MARWRCTTNSFNFSDTVCALKFFDQKKDMHAAVNLIW